MPAEYLNCVKGLIAYYKKHGKTPQEAEKMADLSMDQKRQLIEGELNPGDRMNVWIKDLYDDRVVINDDGRLFEMPYSILDGKVTFGARTEVKTAYEPLAEIKGLEIFEAGTYRGRAYAEKALDEMVANFEALKDTIKPTLVVGHSESQKLLKDSGLPSAGWMSALRRAGTKLVADFREVPKVIAALIGKGAYRRVSSEIYHNFDDRGHALRRVALLGGEIPEVKTLQDVLALYADGEDTTWVIFDESPQSTRKEKNTMSDNNNKLEKLQEDMTKLSGQVATLTAEKSDLSEKIKTLEAEKKAALETLSEKAKAEKALKVRAMFQPLREKGLAPAVAGRLQAFAERLDASAVEKFGEDEHTLLDEFGAVLESMHRRDADGTLIVPFGEVAPGSDGERGTDEDEREKAVQRYMETHKAGYKDALVSVSRERPELFSNR